MLFNLFVQGEHLAHLLVMTQVNKKSLLVNRYGLIVWEVLLLDVFKFYLFLNIISQMNFFMMILSLNMPDFIIFFSFFILWILLIDSLNRFIFVIRMYGRLI